MAAQPLVPLNVEDFLAETNGWEHNPPGVESLSSLSYYLATMQDKKDKEDNEDKILVNTVGPR